MAFPAMRRRPLAAALAAALLTAGCGPVPFGTAGPEPRTRAEQGPVMALVATTEFPLTAGYPAAAAPDVGGRPPVVLYSDHDEGLSVVRATRPVYTVRSLRADRSPLPDVAPDAEPAGFALDGDGNALSVVSGGPGRLLSIDADGSMTRSDPLTGPLDGRPDLVVAAAFAGRGTLGYVLRTEKDGSTVELTALRDGRVGAQRLTDLGAAGPVWLRGLFASPDGSRLAIAYEDGGTAVLATFDAELRPVSTIPLGAAADADQQVAVDDHGVAHVLRSQPGDDPGVAPYRIHRFAPDGDELAPVDIREVWYPGGLTLAPPERGSSDSRRAYVTGESSTTGVLGVFVIDLTTGRTGRTVPLCTDTNDGVIGPPVLSVSGASMTVVGYCHAVDSLWELGLPADAVWPRIPPIATADTPATS